MINPGLNEQYLRPTKLRDEKQGRLRVECLPGGYEEQIRRINRLNE
jgi:hypothetical protein